MAAKAAPSALVVATQQTVAAVLATVSHHSYPKVDTAYDGQRAQRTVTSTGRRWSARRTACHGTRRLHLRGSGLVSRRSRKPAPQSPKGGGRRARRPTGTEDCQSRWCAAGRPDGARAAGRGSHGRLRGCPGAYTRGAVGGWWRQRRWHHRQGPPRGGGGGRREEEAGEAAQEGARGGEAACCPCPDRPLLVWGSLLFLEEEEEEEEEKTSWHCFSLGVWVLPEEYMDSSPSSPHCLVPQWLHVHASVLLDEFHTTST